MDRIPTSRVADLRDVTAMAPAWLVKGAAAESWFRDRSVDLPATIFASTETAGRDRVTRTGADEFLVEAEQGSSVAQELSAEHDVSANLVVLERQDAVFRLVGERAGDVIAQTCGINWNDVPPEHLVMTRVAGVSCGVRQLRIEDGPYFVIRLDPTYGVYLWRTLLSICNELTG